MNFIVNFIVKFINSFVNFNTAFSGFLRRECTDSEQPATVCIPVEALLPGCVLSACAYIQDLSQEEHDP